jgi:hypothetical protein
VPAQALILLNDPLVTSLADHWAGSLLRDDCHMPAERVQRMFLTAFAREPEQIELQRWVDAVADFSNGGDDLMQDQQAWSDLAHAMFNTKEFIYFR